jgi:hypothetical protein
MKLKELKTLSKTKQPLSVAIVSDGYDYCMKVQHFHEVSLLTDNKNNKLRFKNLGDAEDVLRRIGIHQATLNQVIPCDEFVSPGALSLRQQESQMPISF